MSNTSFMNGVLHVSFAGQQQQRAYLKFAAKTPELHASFSMAMSEKFHLSYPQREELRKLVAGEENLETGVIAALDWINA